MNDDPGFSLFQGKGLNLDNSSDRLAEEEELADHKRRNDELHCLVQDAFSDLGDDLMNSVDSTGTSIMRSNDITNFTEQITQLKHLLESKTHEIIKMSDILEASEKQTDELQKRLAICDAERARAVMGCQQTHELLVESKSKISNLEDSILQLQSKIRTSEDENNNLVAELEHTKTMLSDAQHKFRMVEKNAGISAEKRTNDAIEQIQNRTSAQITLMQERVDSLREKLHDKEHECRNLETKYKTSVRSREQMLAEKSETINQLSHSLEDSQRQLKNMIPSTDLIKENIKLKRMADDLNNQTENMDKQIKQLTQQLETTTNEMALMDSVLHADGMSSTKRSVPGTPEDHVSNLKKELFNCARNESTRKAEIKSLQRDIKEKDDLIKNLKADENDALIKMNNHREEAERWRNKYNIIEMELGKIQRERRRNSYGDEKCARDESQQETKKLEEKNEQLEMKFQNANENYEQAKRELQELQERHAKLDSERKSFQQSLQASLDECKHNLEKEQFLHNDAKEELYRNKNLYISLSNERDNIARELSDLKSSDMHKELYIQKEKVASLERSLQLTEMKCSELNNIISKEKTDHEQIILEMRRNFDKDHRSNVTLNNCSKCIQESGEIAKLQIQNVQLQTEAATNLRDIHGLRQRLISMESLNQELQSRIQLKDEHDQMLTELKQKALMFEEFVRSQNESAGAMNSPQRKQCSDKSVSTSPDLDASNSARVESRLHNEMAKTYALQLRKAEAQFQQFETKAKQLEKLVEEERDKMETKSHEVEVLKHVILTERKDTETVIHSLRSKLEELNLEKEEALRNYHSQEGVLNQYQNLLREAKARLELYLRDKTERCELWDDERASHQALKQTWASEKAAMVAKEADLKLRIEGMEQHHNLILDQWKEKYRSSKKWASNYKQFAEDKEKHMLQEYDRIKLGYENNLQKIESRMLEFKKNLEEKQKIKIESVRSEYEKRLIPNGVVRS